MTQSLNLTSRAASQSYYISKKYPLPVWEGYFKPSQNSKTSSLHFTVSCQLCFLFHWKIILNQKSTSFPSPWQVAHPAHLCAHRLLLLWLPLLPRCLCKSDPHHSRLLWLSALVTSVPSLSCLIDVSPSEGPFQSQPWNVLPTLKIRVLPVTTSSHWPQFSATWKVSYPVHLAFLIPHAVSEFKQAFAATCSALSRLPRCQNYWLTLGSLSSVLTWLLPPAFWKHFFHLGSWTCLSPSF